MLRGSRPGERRGGRKRGTPNRRTNLRDRILSIGLDHPAASQRAFLFKLVKDRKLPAETRMAVAPNCFPPKRTRSFRTGRPRALIGSRTTIAQEALATGGSAVASKGSQTPAVVPAIRDWNPRALDALFGVVQDATANPKTRRKAALKIAEFLLPKVGKKAKVIPDEYGFSINPNLASAYRDIQLELRALVNEPTRKIPAIAEKIKKLEARSDAIRRRLQVPCPSKYGNNEAANDWVRLMEFTSLRDNETALTEAQKAEEAHLRARFDVVSASPESIARRRRKALQDAERQFKKSRLTGEFYAAPLSRKDRNELKLLRWLYPEPKRDLSQLDGVAPEVYRDHPFEDELLAPNGNFYPRHSKLRWLEQLGKIERRKLTPKEDPEDQQKPELLSKSRIHDLEERRAVGFELTASEEQELRDLRERYPEFAAVMDLMDLAFLYHWRREVEIARKAGLNTFAMFKQADVICLHLRDPTKFTTESDAEEYRRVRRQGHGGGLSGAIGS
jgi:hypothetical protein